MADWLDDLSEDWVSQPGSSPAPTIHSTTGSVSRSRIPRPKSFGSSTSQHTKRQEGAGSTRIVAGKGRGILAEHTESQRNINSTPPSQKRTRPARTVSISSSRAGAFDGTVAVRQDTSPAKDINPQITPEWKKRLLHGQMGYADQKDLFSPIGLQNIFQQPAQTPSSKPEGKRRALLSFSGADAIPSSPPPWPKPQDLGRKPPAKSAKSVARAGKLRQGSEEPGSEIRHTKEGSHSLGQSSLAAVRSPSKTDLDNAFLEHSRTVSGQTELRDEEFSPVYISKHANADGQIDYAPLDLSRSQIAEQIKHLSLQQHSTSQGVDSEIGQESKASVESASELDFDSTLPEDLPHGTPDSVRIGTFVTTKRGGYSADGSFRNRPLSPSPLSRNLTEIQAPETVPNSNRQPQGAEQPQYDQSVEDSTLPQDSNELSPIPKTPSRTRQAEHLSPETPKSRPSASPLKLFDNHDTFTNNRLLRRMSRLEDPEDNLLQEKATVSGSPDRNTSMDEQEDLEGESSPLPLTTTPGKRQISFGQGQLDQYPFPEAMSPLTPERSDRSEVELEGSPSPSAAPPGSRPTFKFRINSVSDMDAHSSAGSKRRHSRGSSAISSLPRGSIKSKKPVKLNQTASQSKLQVVTEPEQPVYAEGKRPPASPFKNPTPKRRRTLVTEDVLQYKEESMHEVYETHSRMQSIIGHSRQSSRKRISSRQDSRNVADPDTLARRRILRPRNPTPSQRRKQEIEDEILDATEAFMSSSPRLESIREHLVASVHTEDEEQAKSVASEVAAFSMKIKSVPEVDQRKRSITTQDFLDEAMMIMNFLRNKKRPSTLGSVAESRLEEADDEEYDEYLEDEEDEEEHHVPSDLTFERPPSREGGSAWRSPDKVTHNAEVAGHLKMYKDRTDDDFMLSSMRSLRIDDKTASLAQDWRADSPRYDTWETREPAHGSPSKESAGESQEVDSIKTIPSHKSNPSIDSSVSRTIVTSASRTSQNVATLAPDAVAHLIPEEVAGMSFDKDKGLWVRSKSLSPTKIAKSPGAISAATHSDEDPLAGIPDLTVNELEEIERISPSRKPTQQFLPGDLPNAKSARSISFKTSMRHWQERPRTRDGSGMPPMDTSSAPSKWSHFASSEPQIETRATSWSEQEAGSHSRKVSAQALSQAIARIPEADEVEHEIQIDEGRSTLRHNRPIQVSISPALSIPPTQSTVRHHEIDVDEEEDDDLTVENTHSMIERDNISLGLSSPLSAARTHVSGVHAGYGYRGAARRIISTAATTTQQQDMSLMSTAPRQRQLNFSLSVVRSNKGDALLAEPATPATRADVTFLLSDLPDFTVDQIDERELPDRAVVKSNLHTAACYNEDRFESGNDVLVKALQDFAPEELYWEDLRSVDLEKKGLTSLHLLDTLCDRVEELNVSHNGISQLGGVPHTVRSLNAGYNLLSSLTSWDYLVHLQYLDVSGNEIESLAGISSLVHLRELKADHNRIDSLEGAMSLDGLLKLSLRDNKIEHMDFDGAELKRLTHLDLASNGLNELHNLQNLPSLTHLDLDDNNLPSFGEYEWPSEMLARSAWRGQTKLQSLRVCTNNLNYLDVRHLPQLEELYVDGNQLSAIDSLSACSKLRVLSARNQALETPEEFESLVSSIGTNPEVQALYLSANALPTIDLPTSFLNLRILELANCGLVSLPDGFGSNCPNLRVLNLNFNALKDLRPLLNVRRLGELHVAGNRLQRLRKNAAVMSMLRGLTKIDLRGNPFAIGFFAPATENRLTLTRKPEPMDADDEDNEAVEDRGAYELPPVDKDVDRKYQDLLDDDTKLRRRVYEMLLANSCSGLRVLDGLPFDRKEILVKDDIWRRLIALGVLRKSTRGEDSVNESLRSYD